MQKKNYWQLILFAIFIPGCDIEPQEPLRIGVSTWAGFEFLFLAEQKGFFQEENRDVKLVEFSSLSDTRIDSIKNVLFAKKVMP